MAATPKVYEGRLSRLSSFLHNAEKAAKRLLAREYTNQELDSLAWETFEQIDIVTLAIHGGGKSDNVTWPQHGDTLRETAARFVLKAVAECTERLKVYLAYSAAASSPIEINREAADRLMDSTVLLARATSTMLAGEAWAIGMSSLTSLSERDDAAEIKARVSAIEAAIRAELPSWNSGSAGKLAQRLKTSAKNIRERKKKIAPTP